MSKSFKELLSEARRPRRVVSICMRGDLTSEAQRLEDEISDLAANPRPASGRLTDGGEREALAAQLQDIRDRMLADSVQFELEAQSAVAWRQLKAAHPVPSEPTRLDTVVGAEATGFFNEAVRAAIVDPKVDDDDWARLTEILSDGEWSKLIEAVYALNEEPVSIPFSSRAYEILSTQSDDSESLEMLE